MSRSQLLSFSANQWQAFASQYSSKPTKPYVELMRAVMVAINYTPKIQVCMNLHTLLPFQLLFILEREILTAKCE